MVEWSKALTLTVCCLSPLHRWAFEKVASNLRLGGAFRRVLWFSPPLTTVWLRISLNMAEKSDNIETANFNYMVAFRNEVGLSTSFSYVACLKTSNCTCNACLYMIPLQLSVHYSGNRKNVHNANVPKCQFKSRETAIHRREETPNHKSHARRRKHKGCETVHESSPQSRANTPTVASTRTCRR